MSDLHFPAGPQLMSFSLPGWVARWTDPHTNCSLITWVGASSESSARSTCDCLKLQFVGPMVSASPGSDEDASAIANWGADWRNVVEGMED